MINQIFEFTAQNKHFTKFVLLDTLMCIYTSIDNKHYSRILYYKNLESFTKHTIDKNTNGICHVPKFGKRIIYPYDISFDTEMNEIMNTLNGIIFDINRNKK